jgi:hypothetical protein
LFANNNEDKSAIDVAISGDILTVSSLFLMHISIGIPRVHHSIKRDESNQKEGACLKNCKKSIRWPKQ